ncbi:sensor domain-containing protein [Litchfieldia alkalitelluris]|uniref:sensor domain-containing protein n=1 Tax=Litchfieldia alkalitelluris TaxID=304268 RepID=UPI0009983617|nr:GGDEF and EAL domain-containing protein [Litchfieldia alkalitelluris]
MSFKGKVFFSVPFVFITIGLITYELYINNPKEAILHGIVGTLATILSWILGAKYDESKYYAQKLLEKSEELDTIFENSSIFTWINDSINKKVTTSKGIQKVLGYTSKDFEENYEFGFSRTFPDDEEKIQKLLSGEIHQCEWKFIRKDGEVRWLESRGIPSLDSSNRVEKVKGVTIDITERKIIEEKYSQRNKELVSLFENDDSFIWSSDLIEQKVTVSKGIENIFGFSAKEFEEDYELWISRTYPDDIDIVQTFYTNLKSGKPAHSKWRFIRSDGEARWLEARGNPILESDEKPIKLIGVAYDITEEQRSEEKIRYLAFHDTLTGLPNRYMLIKTLKKALDRCKRSNKNVAVLFLDLDRFKFINDTKGHNSGDVLLKEVGKRLVKCVREGDLIARQGGDEFIILLEDIKESQLKELSQRIIDSFIQPFILDKEEFFISTSIGISLYPQDGDDSEKLIKHADIAMYWAKKRGKNNYQFYFNEPEDILYRKVKLEQGLRNALNNSEFVLHYQPQMELDKGECIGVEALIRWNHPEFGMVPPFEFIPIAEETGVIVQIGEWVIDEACKQMKLWYEKGFVPFRIAVNVSAIQFLDKNFFKVVERILNKHQLAPEFLELEITESIMQNIKESSTLISQLKELGVKMTIDDFGTGYSSLNVLNRLSIDYVKIDKSFVDEVSTNSNIASLVKTMIDMGTNLKFELIAEGIENEQQVNFLIQNGCRFGQGYFYSAPLPLTEVEEFLKTNK